MNRVLKLALVGGISIGLASCATAQRLWPFGDDERPSAVASEGQRIPIIGLTQSLTASPALAGVDFFIPAPTPAAAWPLPGGTPEQSVEHVDAAPAFEIAWRRDIGAGSSRNTQVTAPPVAVNGRIYTMDGEATVAAFDAATGAQAWRTNIRPEGRDKNGFGGGLAVADGRVFATSGFRTVAALDAASGAVLWTSPVDSPIHAAPTVASGRVYAVDVDNQILAFDTQTGEQEWSYQAIVEPARILKASSPAVSGDALIAPFSSGELVAMRAANGNPLWTDVLSRTSRTNALSELRDIAGRPVIYRGDVFAASHSGVFVALDLRTGARRWELPVASINAPWPAGDVVYIVSNAGELIAANRENGQVYWVSDLNEGRVRQEGGLFGIGDRTVRPSWAGPLLASNRLILVNSDGEAAAVDAKTGAIQRTIKLGSPAYISPIAHQGMVYVVTDEGELVAIR